MIDDLELIQMMLSATGLKRKRRNKYIIKILK